LFETRSHCSFEALEDLVVKNADARKKNGEDLAKLKQEFRCLQDSVEGVDRRVEELREDQRGQEVRLTEVAGVQQGVQATLSEFGGSIEEAERAVWTHDLECPTFGHLCKEAVQAKRT
jgi:hypothetical protein